MVIISGPGVAFVAHVDTFRVDGKSNQWLPGHRGILRTPYKAAESYGVAVSVSRRLWPGESWQVSADGRRLTHEYQWKAKADSVHRVVMIYRRSAD